MTLPITIKENKKPNTETGETITYRNLDIRELKKGQSFTFKNLGEPKVIDGEYGARYMFNIIVEDNQEVTTFINGTMKVTGPGVPFGKKVFEFMSENVGDITVTRLKESNRGLLKGTDKFDLWSMRLGSKEPEQIQNTSPAVEGGLVLTDDERKLVDQKDLFTKPFEQIKELFDAYSVPEERAKRIYEEYKGKE